MAKKKKSNRPNDYTRKGAKAKRKRLKEMIRGNGLLPAKVRVNPRTGKVQVFVTPQVAAKVRNPKSRVEKPNRRWVLMGRSRRNNKWVNLRFSNTFPPLEKAWNKLQNTSIRGTHPTYSDFKIEARNL